METVMIYIYLFVAFAIAVIFFKAFDANNLKTLAALCGLIEVIVLLVAFGYAVVSAARLIF